ncbi:hypothetical protein [Shewanella sp. OMA3-2]|uniref:hypothetical protein n=1 Tax=Shewanella sp. OMA3-2 TaxID=2908650 RepID=UPI001F23D0A1|nr:hypothetical protein [Shewanella sp. OMA3-2]UJF21695.1 hypothetical protein L0B17_16830 [Shewanella sp. OMA3-2]
MTNVTPSTDLQSLSQALEKDLLEFYGAPMLQSEKLKEALGYRSIDALRQAINRGTVPVHVFTIPNRRGKFALVKDVAYWLAEQRLQSESHQQEEKKTMK